MGLSSSSDEWCRHSDRVVEGFPWCRKIVDDVLIWASTPSELEDRISQVVSRCQVLHVTLSRSKFQVDTTLSFAGCIVSHSGVKPDPSRVSALSSFPTPTDQTSVRSFLGLCNQLAFFVPDYQHHTASLRQLTGKGKSFLWLPEHQVEFDKLKTILSSDLIVRHFDHTKHVYLLTDASRLYGVGYALGHIESDSTGKNVFKIVHCGSKGLTPTQQRYSTIELECFAIIWAILKCSFYLRGLPKFTVYTDHRPLHGVFQKDVFDLASPRLQRLREKVTMFSFDVEWVPGKTHLIADALSRAPLFSAEEMPGLEIDTAISCLSQTSQPSMDVIYNAVDDDYRQFLQDVIQNTSYSNYSKALHGSVDSLSVQDNLVLLDSRRIVLPLLAVKPVLRLLHASHSGITKTTVLAKALYFWPGMSNDIKQLISSCVQCAKVLPSQPSNPMVTPSPSTHFGFPMQHVGLDLFSFGTKTYLICVDHWSGYPFYSSLRSLSTATVISTLSTWFNLFGWPMSIRSDGGPQFRGDFSRFCEKNDIRHELSAPYNPKSNGLAEAGVKSIKNILRKSMSSGEDADRMLYEWRNVPRSDGFSPAQLLFGRAQRTSLPTLASQVTPVDFISAASSKDAAHMRARLDHDRSKHFLPLLSPGQAVYLQDSKSSAWDRHGVISSIRPDKLSYVVHCDGRYFTRPRRLLRPVHSATPIDASSPTSAVLPPPVLPRRSPRLFSRSPKAHVQFSPSTTSSPLRPPSPSTDSSPVLPSTSASASSHSPSPHPSTSWLPFSSPTVKASSTRLTRRSWSRRL